MRCVDRISGALLAGAMMLGVAHGQAKPDVVIFTNGDQLSGQFERGVGDSIVFKSDMAGEVTIPLAKVKELRSTGSFAMLRKNAPMKASSVSTGTVTVADGKVTVADPEGTAQTAPIGEVAYLIDQKTYDRDLAKKPGFFYGWNGTVTAGASFVRSTQNSTTFNGGVALIRAIPTVPWLVPKNRTTVNVAEAYGKQTQPVIPPTVPASPDIITKTSIFHADAERDQYFSPRFFALGQTAFDHNFSQGLELSQTYGVGMGWTAIKQPVQQLDLKVDAHYLKQTFESTSPGVAPSPTQDLIGTTFSEVYMRKLPLKMTLNEQGAIIPAWNNTNAYAANVGAVLLLPVIHRFSFNISASDNFLNDPAQYFKKNSVQFMTGLTYSLK